MCIVLAATFSDPRDGARGRIRKLARFLNNPHDDADVARASDSIDNSGRNMLFADVPRSPKLNHSQCCHESRAFLFVPV
jgi:hypothetical protein